MNEVINEAISVLTETRYMSSPTANKIVAGLDYPDCVLAMNEVIKHLSQVNDWKYQPRGFAGASLLAVKSSDAAKIFRKFVNEEIKNHPVWLKVFLKYQSWYVEENPLFEKGIKILKGLASEYK